MNEAQAAMYGKKIVWWPLIVGAGLVGLSLFGILSKASARSYTASSSDEATVASIKFETIRQAVPKGSRLATDENSLRSMEQMIKSLLARNFGQPADRFTVKMEPLAGFKGTILQRTWIKEGLVNSEIMTIVDSEKIAVNCTSKHFLTAAPKFKGTPCGTQVLQVLKIDIANVPGDI